MRFKGEVYIYAGLFTLDSDGEKKLKRFDIVIVYTVYSWTDKYVSVEHSQKGGIYAVDVDDLIPYEEFPEDDPVDTRSIAFWNKISRNRLVFYKDLKTYG